jgi:hypothetical protein
MYDRQLGVRLRDSGVVFRTFYPWPGSSGKSALASVVDVAAVDEPQSVLQEEENQ